MRKFTNLMRLLMVAALSVTIIAGQAQRYKPTGIKAPPQSQVTVVKAEKPVMVEENTTADAIEGVASGQAPYTSTGDLTKIGGPTDATL